jgi:predicted transcriptional regulator
VTTRRTPGRTTKAAARNAAQVSELTEELAQSLVDLGMPRMPARMLMYLMTARASRLSAAELAAALQASPAAISGAVRYLEQTTLIRRTREPGTRHDVYGLVDGWYAAGVLRTQMLAAFATVADQTADALEARGDPEPMAANRLREMSDYFTFMGEEAVGLLARWEEHRGR